MIRRPDERYTAANMTENPRVILVTGAARRIGAEIARVLHADGARVIVHFRHSATEAEALVAALNAIRRDSARALCADLLDVARLPDLARRAHALWGRLDALVNNASSYFSTPLPELGQAQYDELLGSNLGAPLFLAQACAPLLADGGSIVNLLDVHARRPIAGFSAYLAAKGALWTTTEALALDLAPRLRVNGVAPGLMSPEQPQFPPEQLAREAARIPLQRFGCERDVAVAVRFLLAPEAAYINGAILPVDGGLRLA